MSHNEIEGHSIADRLSGFIAGLLVGALVGASAMFLLAPRSGEKTRSQLQKQGAKMRHQAVDSIESIEDVVTVAGDKAHKFTDTVQKGVDDLSHQAQDLLGKGR